MPHFSNLGDVPPGHDYSPIPSIPDIQQNEARLFGNVARTHTFMGHFHTDLMNARIPLFMRNPGASFWIRKAR